MPLSFRKASSLIAVASSLLVGACAAGDKSAAAPEGNKQSAAQANADAFDAEFLAFDSGEPIQLASLRGKVVFLDIWASWCAPCKEEMPVLDELAKKFAGQPVEVIALTIDEEKEPAAEFLATQDSWALTVGHDPEGKIPDALQPPKMPSSYVLDKTGEIRFTNAGYERGDAAKFEKQINELLAQ